MENYLKPYKWTYLNEVVDDQIINRNKQTILELQMPFQNHDMYLFGELIQQELMYKQPIHLYMILLIYRTTLMYLDVISKLEMEMNTPIFTINQQQTYQGFTEVYLLIILKIMTTKVEQFLI